MRITGPSDIGHKHDLTIDQRFENEDLAFPVPPSQIFYDIVDRIQSKVNDDDKEYPALKEIIDRSLSIGQYPQITTETGAIPRRDYLVEILVAVAQHRGEMSLDKRYYNLFRQSMDLITGQVMDRVSKREDGNVRDISNERPALIFAYRSLVYSGMIRLEGSALVVTQEIDPYLSPPISYPQPTPSMGKPS